MRSPTHLSRAFAERTGLIRLARLHREAADFSEAVAENRMLDLALAERVAELEQIVGEIAHKRSLPSTGE